MDKVFYWITLFVLTLAMSVIILGAYTRLSDAGLGCPDWPRCYGQLILPQTKTALEKAQAHFPSQPIIMAKAWKEMLHRYSAGLLGVLIFILVTWNIARYRKKQSNALMISLLLIGIIAFQVLLGLWTITTKVMPIVVVGHLLGGMTIAALLVWLSLHFHTMSQSREMKQQESAHYHCQALIRLKPWVLVGLFILALQIFLGAWTSTNYAALACPNFPYCTSVGTPPFAWREAFHFIMPMGPNYEGGHLSLSARMTIQMLHRYGALITVAFWLPFALYLATNKIDTRLRPWGWVILILLTTQCTLGVLNVVNHLPMLIALSHNGVATALLVTVVAFLHKITRRPLRSTT